MLMDAALKLPLLYQHLVAVCGPERGRQPYDELYESSCKKRLPQFMGKTIVDVIAAARLCRNGFDWSRQRDPLLGPAGGSHHEFLSHLDFRDILVSAMTGKAHTDAQGPIYTMGNSGELVYGKISPGGKYTFINDRTSLVKSNEPPDAIGDFNKSFQKYLNYFETLKAGKTERDVSPAL